MDHSFVCRLDGITERLHASCSHRESVCWRRPVSRDSCRALTASLPVSLSSIFCLYASENGLVTSLSLPRPTGPKASDNYPDAGGWNELLPVFNRSTQRSPLV